jgi:hypothetical protein
MGIGQKFTIQDVYLPLKTPAGLWYFLSRDPETAKIPLPQRPEIIVYFMEDA